MSRESKISTVVPIRLPNEAVAVLDELIERSEGMNRTAWLRGVILEALEAQGNDQEVSAA